VLLALINACRNALIPRKQDARLQLRTCLTVTLHGILFGIDTRAVREIVRYRILAEPRNKPPYIRGLFRHRSIMIPVLDLAARYGHGAIEPGGRTCIVIVELGLGKWRKEVGLIVDEVRGLSEFPVTEMKPMPEMVHKMLEVEIVEGVVKLERDYLIVVDSWQMLSGEEAREVAGYLKQLGA